LKLSFSAANTSFQQYLQLRSKLFESAIPFLVLWPLGLAWIAVDSLRASINLDFAEKILVEQNKLVG